MPKKIILIIFYLLVCRVLFAQPQLHPKKSAEKLKDWRPSIDSLWSGGFNTQEQIDYFDRVWNEVNKNYACFNNLNVDWDSVKSKYRHEIEAGVSRGRFAAILNYMSLALMESHTMFYDQLVSLNTPGGKGVPLIYPGGWGDNSRFGAALTPLPDSSLLVYQAIPNHPLGLKPGDIVLGYDGIPWKKIYPELLKQELPLGLIADGHFRWGANNDSYTHAWLMGAGLNWHLFDTINIKKFGSGDVLNLPTSLLIGKKMPLYATEQLPVPGVNMPSRNNNEYISWGIVEGTNTGYIYVWSWILGHPSISFFNAVDSLTNILNADALILDFRFNQGGYINYSDDGLSLLFKSQIPTIVLAARYDSTDHFKLRPDYFYSLNPDTAVYFDKPIAVLTGPGAFSAGDFIPLRMTHHSDVRIFGKSTASAYSSPRDMLPSESGYVVTYGWLNGYLQNEPANYLTHKKLKVDETVWFNPGDVRKGEDTIVKSALKWIKSELNKRQLRQMSTGLYLARNFPNPFKSNTLIEYKLSADMFVTIKIYDILGREIKSLVNSFQKQGVYETTFYSGSLSSGIYFYRLLGTDRISGKSQISSTGKMVIIK